MIPHSLVESVVAVAVAVAVDPVNGSGLSYTCFYFNDIFVSILNPIIINPLTVDITDHYSSQLIDHP